MSRKVKLTSNLKPWATYTAEQYSFLFDVEVSGFEQVSSEDVIRYRVKTIRSGAVLECEIYPVWRTGAQAGKARRTDSRDAQARLNEKNAIKRITRLINCNFDESGYHVTLTYKGELPDEESARADVKGYLRKCRAAARKAGSELKYIYVIEFADGDGRRKRVHHHIILEGIDRDTARRLWTKGRVSADELEPDETGSLEGLARYITKQSRIKHSKRWACSKNLKKPQVTISDTKVSRRKVASMAHHFGTERELAKDTLGEVYKGYICHDIGVSYSEVVSGVYITGKLSKDKRQRRNL